MRTSHSLQRYTVNRMRREVVFASMSFSVLAAAIVPSFKADFQDVAKSAGLTDTNIYGGLDRKDYILETTGNGVAILDYDGDGRNDLFIANGTRLNAPEGQNANLPQLYHNEGNGHFKNLAAEAGFKQEGWAQGVCAGDLLRA
jgi:hypothetical protein